MQVDWAFKKWLQVCQKYAICVVYFYAVFVLKTVKSLKMYLVFMNITESFTPLDYFFALVCTALSQILLDTIKEPNMMHMYMNWPEA